MLSTMNNKKIAAGRVGQTRKSIVTRVRQKKIYGRIASELLIALKEVHGITQQNSPHLYGRIVLGIYFEFIYPNN